MTASPQNLFDMSAAFNIDLVVSTMVWFWCSTTPFYYGE
jgi:hypothetical protein